MAALVLVLCVIAISFVILWKTNHLNRKKTVKNIPPLATGALPIVGHTFTMLCNRERFYQNVLETMLGPSLKNGETATTMCFGTWKLYVIMDPEVGYSISNACLKKDFIYKFFEPLLGDKGLLCADVPIWKRHRKLLNPAFNQNVLDAYLIEFNDQSRQLVEALAHQAGKGLFDQTPYIKQAGLQIVCATIMGITADELDLMKKFGDALQTFTACMIERSRKFWYHNDFLFSLSELKKKQEDAARICLTLSYEVLRNRKAKLNAKKGEANKSNDPTKSRFTPFLDFLLDLSNDDVLTECEIQEEMNTFTGAAFDTTYNALVMTLLTLGSYPELQQKVFEEQQKVFGESDRDVEKQDLPKLKYLEAFIKETLRLYPVVALIGRILDKDLNFKKYDLPSGSRCLLSIYHMCRHPVWGPDAEQFRPERWLDGSLPNNTKAFAVFGLGKRSCIGSNFSMMSMKTILSHVVRRYRVSGDVTKLVQQLDIVVTPLSGHHVSIERR